MHALVSKTIISLFVGLMAFATLTGCGQQDTKDQVAQGNDDVNNMNKTLSDLQGKSVFIAVPGLNTFDGKTTVELTEIQGKLEDFISRGHRVIQISQRSDVRATGTEQVELYVSNAEIILKQVKEKIKSPDTKTPHQRSKPVRSEDA